MSKHKPPREPHLREKWEAQHNNHFENILGKVAAVIEMHAPCVHVHIHEPFNDGTCYYSVHGEGRLGEHGEHPMLIRRGKPMNEIQLKEYFQRTRISQDGLCDLLGDTAREYDPTLTIPTLISMAQYLEENNKHFLPGEMWGSARQPNTLYFFHELAVIGKEQGITTFMEAYTKEELAATGHTLEDLYSRDKETLIRDMIDSNPGMSEDVARKLYGENHE